MAFPRIDAQPNFPRFLDTLLLRRSYQRPPLFDFLIAPEHKRQMLGRPVESAADEIAFMSGAGYDYAHVSIYMPHDERNEAVQREKNQQHSQSHGTSQAVITSLEQFRGRSWSWFATAEGDMTDQQPRLDRLAEMADALPDGMKVLLHTADVFTFAWEMIGFSEFCLAVYEEPELIDQVMGTLGEAMLQSMRAAVDRVGDAIGAVIYSDDIAYTEGLMLGPDFFRERLFPLIKQLNQIIAKVHAPLIYHSDGRLYQVFDDLAEIGVRAIQPLEPKSMDPLEIKQRWPGRFCLLGNIDLDLMARGSADQVERHVREKLDRLNATGGYMPGVSNTVPPYVDHANYLRMIETVYSYPDEPIG